MVTFPAEHPDWQERQAGLQERMRLPFALAVVALLAACTGAPVKVLPPEVAQPLVEPLPLRVGVRIEPAVRTYALKDKSVTGATYEIGESAVSTFLAAFRATFADVIELPPETVSVQGGLDAVLELAYSRWTAAPGGAEGPFTEAEYQIHLRDAGGNLLASWASAQRVTYSETVRDPGEKLSWKFTFEEPYSLQLEKSAAAFLRDFRDAPAVRAWLEARGAYRAVLPAPGDAAAPLPAGIYVTSDTASAAMRLCIIKGLQDAVPGRPVITGPGVRRALYPWLSDRPAAALAAERFVALAGLAEARARLAALGVGTVILVAGGTTQDWHGGGLCGAGYGGGGCLGLYWGDRKSILVARILDLDHPQASVQSETTRSGKAAVPMFGLPLPFIPATQSAACHEVSRALAAKLRVPLPGAAVQPP